MNEMLRLSAPMTAWLIGFSGTYGLQALACSRHWPADVAARPVLITVCAVVVGLQVLILVGALFSPSRSRHLQRITVALAATGVVAAVWTLLPVVALSICL